MINYVFDASFILAGLLIPASSANKEFGQLFRLVNRSKAKAHAPILLWMEVANALRFNSTKIELAMKTFAEFTKLPIIPYQLSADQLTGVIKLAYQTETTVYDTSYHYLALELDGTFFTCDKDYYHKAKSLGHITLVAP